MLRFLKATSPAPTNKSKPTTTIGLRLKQNATRDLNTACRLLWSDGAFDLIRWRSLQHIAEEYSAVRNGQFSLMQTVKNLDLPGAPQSGPNNSLHETVTIGCHPDGQSTVRFAHHAIGRHSDSVCRVSHADDKIGEHSWPQLILGIRDL